ncbi:MAG: hypothetical protein U0324_15800 [Polyangiales bacterium]
MRARPFPSLFVAALALAAPAAAQCPASTLSLDPSLAEGRWAAAVAALRDTLTGEGRPWHCAGAAVRFAPGASGAAVLEVQLPSGTVIRRRVASPGELLPTLRAALIVESLAAPEFAPAPPPAAAPPAVDEPARAEAPTPRAPPPPPPARVEAPTPRPVESASIVEANVDVGARVGATPSYVAAAVRATVAFRIRAWSLLAWARFEPWAYRLVDRGPGRYSLDVGAFGVGVGWSARTPLGRVEAAVTLAMDSYTWRDRELLPGQRETVVQARVGALARWSSRWDGVSLSVALDGDVAPVTVFEGTPPASVPAAPAWSVGLAAGVSYGRAL